MSEAERNAVVAEKFMGLKVLRYRDGQLVGTTYDGERCETLASYTTSISAAWEVVERMKADGWNMDLNNALVQYENPEDWHHVWMKDGNHQVVGQAKTAPEAICLASLKALRARGVEV